MVCVRCAKRFEWNANRREDGRDYCSRCYRRAYARWAAAVKKHPHVTIEQYLANGWVKNSPPKIPKAYFTVRARLLLALRTPKWIDLDEMLSIYEKCPAGYHVDHIVPLNGKIFSGLNVPWNLQYLPAAVNVKKGNRL